MEESEPGRVELDEERDEEDTQDVKRIAAEPSEGDEPGLVDPPAADGEDQPEPYERLFEAGTAPDDACAGTGVETDGVRVDEVDGVAAEGEQPIDRGCDMTGHELKGGGDVQPEPSDDVAVFIADHGELPEVVRREERDHEDDDAAIWF